VLERGARLGFFSERFGGLREQDFGGYILPSLASLARYTSTMPPAPRAALISYGPSFVPGTSVVFPAIITLRDLCRALGVLRLCGSYPSKRDCTITSCWLTIQELAGSAEGVNGVEWDGWSIQRPANAPDCRRLEAPAV
jgi:hypothetical protein